MRLTILAKKTLLLFLMSSSFLISSCSHFVSREDSKIDPSLTSRFSGYHPHGHGHGHH